MSNKVPNTAGAYGGKRLDAEYDSDSWSTPQWLFDQLHEQFNFTVDAAADDNNHKCDRYFTEQTNGLLQSWAGERVFFNPPWSCIEDFLVKAHMERHEATLSVGLFKADTSTKWFHWLWDKYKKGECDLDFLKRVQYVPPANYVSRSGNTKPNSPNMGSVIGLMGGQKFTKPIIYPVKLRGAGK